MRFIPLLMMAALAAVLVNCGRAADVATETTLESQQEAQAVYETSVQFPSLETGWGAPFMTETMFGDEKSSVYLSELDPDRPDDPVIDSNLMPNNTPFSIGRNEVIGTSFLTPVGGATLRGVEVNSLPDPPEYSNFAVEVVSPAGTASGLRIITQQALRLRARSYQAVCRVYAAEETGNFVLSLQATNGKLVPITPPGAVWRNEGGGWVTFTAGFEITDEANLRYVPELVLEGGTPGTWYVDFISIYPVEQ